MRGIDFAYPPRRRPPHPAFASAYTLVGSTPAPAPPAPTPPTPAGRDAACVFEDLSSQLALPLLIPTRSRCRSPYPFLAAHALAPTPHSLHPLGFRPLHRSSLFDPPSSLASAFTLRLLPSPPRTPFPAPRRLPPSSTPPYSPPNDYAPPVIEAACALRCPRALALSLGTCGLPNTPVPCYRERPEPQRRRSLGHRHPRPAAPAARLRDRARPPGARRRDRPGGASYPPNPGRRPTHTPPEPTTPLLPHSAPLPTPPRHPLPPPTQSRARARRLLREGTSGAKPPRRPRPPRSTGAGPPTALPARRHGAPRLSLCVASASDAPTGPRRPPAPALPSPCRGACCPARAYGAGCPRPHRLHGTTVVRPNKRTRAHPAPTPHLLTPPSPPPPPWPTPRPPPRPSDPTPVSASPPPLYRSPASIPFPPS
jgi:hypothetical protein